MYLQIVRTQRFSRAVYYIIYGNSVKRFYIDQTIFSMSIYGNSVKRFYIDRAIYYIIYGNLVKRFYIDRAIYYIIYGNSVRSGPTATNWVRYSALISYSSVEDVLNWENSQITATNTAEYILSWVRFSCSQLYWVYTQPHFFRGYKWFHETYKVHKMKNIHQGWCLLLNKSIL